MAGSNEGAVLLGTREIRPEFPEWLVGHAHMDRVSRELKGDSRLDGGMGRDLHFTLVLRLLPSMSVSEVPSILRQVMPMAQYSASVL